MADIYGGFDFLGAGNALSQMQDARQKQQYNAMLMQNTAEDRAREAENRKIAAGNALAERLRKQQFISTIQSGYMPAKTAVMGPGTVQGNTPASFDPEKVKNELLRRGDLSGLVTFSNAQEQIAKQKEQEAKAAGQGLINEETQQKTKLTTAQTDKEQAETLSKYITLHKEQLNSARNYDEAIALTTATYTPGHPMASFLAKNGVSQEQAVAELIRRRDAGIPFEETRALMARGATNAAKDAADLASTKATEKSVLATAAKTEAETEAAAKKLAYERANPGFTIADSAAGKVRINTVTGEVTPLTLNGQPLMPYVKPDPNAVALTPQALDVAAHTYILTGVLPPGMGKNSTEIRTQIMNHATELANGRSAEQFAQDLRVNRNDTAAMKNATTAFGTGTQGKMVNSFNTAIDHLETINDLVAALQNNDTKRINSVSNAIASEFGVAAPANFEAAKQLVSSEIVKAINSSGGALADRQEAESSLSLANSPEQLKGVVDTFQKLLGGQLKSLELQYTNMTGKKDFSAKLTDKAKTALGRVSGSAKNTTTLPAADNAGQPNSGATSTAVDAANPLFLLEPGAN
jgi:hypothetical protein